MKNPIVFVIWRLSHQLMLPSFKNKKAEIPDYKWTKKCKFQIVIENFGPRFFWTNRVRQKNSSLEKVKVSGSKNSQENCPNFPRKGLFNLDTPINQEFRVFHRKNWLFCVINSKKFTHISLPFSCHMYHFVHTQFDTIKHLITILNPYNICGDRLKIYLSFWSRTWKNPKIKNRFP